MRKDIVFPVVEGIRVAIACQDETAETPAWAVYLLNTNAFDIDNVLVVSKGYSEKQQPQQQRTSILRQYLGTIAAGEHIQIELIDPSVFHLFNEYWVSYYVDGQIYDKKFIFVPESIIGENLVYIPQLKLKGVLHY
ncbi:MAG: hypothetical protein RMJ87_10305 [Cytophagales bacterium]|nr:hypothetical protein [Bernardetiaceae bacterium]MDW8205411.1 hypothetical protein [Cytophagales bacterium]